MSTERKYTAVSSDKLPKDQKITDIQLTFMNQEFAEAYGLPDDIVPEREPDVLFYVALGLNSKGEVVGAKLLSKRPVDNEAEHWIRKRIEDGLEEKARKAFGLILKTP